jgi:hypothetical protein
MMGSEDFHKELDHRIQVKTQATKTLVKSMQHGLKARIVKTAQIVLPQSKVTMC